MSNRRILLPYVLRQDADRSRVRVWPEHGKQGRRYVCPDCGGRVFFKHGNAGHVAGGRIPHFAHAERDAEKGEDRCFHKGGGETEEHRRACYAAETTLGRWMSGAELMINVSCAEHSSHAIPLPIERPDPRNVELVVNRKLPDRNRRPDVRIVRTADRMPLLCVEVFVTNVIDESRAASLDGVSWIEIPAADAATATWNIRRHGISHALPACTRLNRAEDIVRPISPLATIHSSAQVKVLPPNAILPAASSVGQPIMQAPNLSCSAFKSIALMDDDFRSPESIRAVLRLQGKNADLAPYDPPHSAALCLRCRKYWWLTCPLLSADDPIAPHIRD